MKLQESEGFDVFLCYHSRDRPAVEAIAQRLKDRELRPWFDQWELPPGRSWHREIAKHLSQIPSAAVFVGSQGLGPWQKEEIDALLLDFVDRDCPVIPVLLEDCPAPSPRLPVFLASRTWVDFRQTNPDPLKQLIWGITEKRPKRPTPHYPDPETRDLSHALESAFRQRANLIAQGQNVQDVTETILDLRRKIREGGRLKAGDVLHDGRFQLLELIDQGGFGEVWKAYDLKKHTIVAVKVLHGQYVRDETRRKRFFRGARQMAMLQHPGIVRVIEEECVDGGYYFFVMEYVAGGDLRQAVKTGRLTLEELLWILVGVSEALTFAHVRGVIHRDVKPGNILLDPENRPKLTDFDLVRALDTTGGTRTTMLGTFLYSAPEALMDAKVAAEPVDVYGLGMTAVFICYGTDLPLRVQWQLPEFVGALQTSEMCRLAIRRAVAQRVEDRWPTVAEFGRALRAILEPSVLPHLVKSPIVGTFYREPNPEKPPFVEVGDRVSQGQVLCIIEAMKLMNEIESDVDGVVVEVYPASGQPVEYGEPLVAIQNASEDRAKPDVGRMISPPDMVKPAPLEAVPLVAPPHHITSSSVGVFHRALYPEAKPLVEVGSSVEQGQVLCFLEVMGQMIEVESDVDGVVGSTYPVQAQLVESGEPLFRIEIPQRLLRPPQTEARKISAVSSTPARDIDDLEDAHFIMAPCIGHFYRSPSPDAEPFVDVGDRVRKGQVVCLLEAMKLMNEIESDVDGIVIKRFPENGQPVEYGEPLFAIKTS